MIGGMSNVIVLDDAVFTKLEKNAEKEGVSPEVWIENVVNQEFMFAHLPKFSDKDRAEMNGFSKDLDRRFAEMMKKRYRKKMGLDRK
jgi:hypothetical protein